MTQVVYDRMWVTNVVTGEQIGARTDPSIIRTSTVSGETRVYAGGRIRSVGRPGLNASWPFTLKMIHLAQVEMLETWMDVGVTVFARDAVGQAMYGTFYSVERSRPPAQSMVLPVWSAAIDLRRVTVVEGV
jgi:hypothetical protein